MVKTIPLIPGNYYHIYNRGNNREDIFIEERKYVYFMNLYAKYVPAVAETYAYCLLKNHFHVLIKIRDLEGFIRKTHQIFSNLLTDDDSHQRIEIPE